MKKLTLEHLAGYLPYGLKVWHTDWNCELTMNATGSGSDNLSIEDVPEYAKPILRPLSDMTKLINYGLSSCIFIELFEIGDTDGFIYEFDHGNIKLLKQIASISLHNSANDINYLPYPVVQMMREYHFDTHGLIEKGLAIDINTLK